MSIKSIKITKQLRETINDFLGVEFIPACAVGSELAHIDGNLVIKTFQSGDTHGYRKLTEDGELVNIIAELGN